MRYNAHDYQKYATKFILQHPIAAVFLEMGLGKSVIMLTALFDLILDQFVIGKVLVIAPLPVARDEEREDEAYKGHYFINANSNTPPQIVDRAVKPILDRSEMYSGCYARVSLSFYAFNSNGNKGVACGLANIQKVRDGEPLGGRTNAADDFATLDDDDFLS